MDKRFTIFAIVAIAVIAANQLIYSFFFPAPPAPKVPLKAPRVAKVEPRANDQPHKDEPAPEKSSGALKPAAENEAGIDNATAEPNRPAIEPRWLTLGSADANSPYRLLVTLTNQGAAIERVEFNSPRFRDLENRSGYFGQLASTSVKDKSGALVHVVGAGTPAARAGLKVDDVITAIGDRRVTSSSDLIAALRETVPRQSVTISIIRQGANEQLTAELGRHPLEVIRPEWNSSPLDLVPPKEHDPFSFLLTIQQFDDRTLGIDDHELAGVELRNATWEVVSASQDAVSFRATVAKLGLQVVKTYRLDKVPEQESQNAVYPAYSFDLRVSISNIGDTPHQVAYRLDGPTGLPIEGAWYASKVGRVSGAGLRDVVARFEGGSTTEITCPQIADPDFKQIWTNEPLKYTAVDGIYFAAAIIPRAKNPTDVWFAEVKPTRVGAVPPDKANIKLTNVSFRLDSVASELKPGAAPLEHDFQVFVGPKKPALLEQYGPENATLYDLVYYGWFSVVAKPMLAILHAFHAVVGNYGVAIIMLTVLVRGCMFPLGRKQAMSAQKMQELQPEIKRINEKFKAEPDKKARAQQDLFRAHKYNPLGGCLLAFVQLPIFVGLYRSLQVDVELRQAPLFGEAIRWASNLAAPDMLWDWSGVVPHFVAFGTGFLGLGPYLNLFPLISIGMILWSQKMLMPPPADEQAAMQQKMMQYMMVFMGVFFFKWASGLCLYTIASSIWGICERKLLPKTKRNATGTGPALATNAAPPTGNGAAGNKKRQRGRK